MRRSILLLTLLSGTAFASSIQFGGQCSDGVTTITTKIAADSVALNAITGNPGEFYLSYSTVKQVAGCVCDPKAIQASGIVNSITVVKDKVTGGLSASGSAVTFDSKQKQNVVYAFTQDAKGLNSTCRMEIFNLFSPLKPLYDSGVLPVTSGILTIVP